MSGVNSHSMTWPSGTGPGLYKQIFVGKVRSMTRVEADLLLAVVWNETASGTARSKTEVLLKVDALNS